MPCVLIVGCGGREFSIGKKLIEENPSIMLAVVGQYINPGLKNIAEFYYSGVNINDGNQVVKYAMKCYANLVFIGSENSLFHGVTDALLNANIPCIGPTQEQAMIETSKSFARNLIHTCGLMSNNPKYQVISFDKLEIDDNIPILIEKLENEFQGNYVIKADSLRGGKGVKISGSDLSNTQEALDYCVQLIHEDGKFIIEEKLVGQEFSLMSFTDGHTLSHMPLIQDYKKAFDNNQGPNTGGMGCISLKGGSFPFLDKGDLEIAHSLNETIIQALNAKTDTYYVGIIYGSYMKTNNGEIKIIEFNARFGDPECINLMRLLQTNLYDIFCSMVNGCLNQINVVFRDEYSLSLYVCPEGYPFKPIQGAKIQLGDAPEDLLIPASMNDQGIMLGSRALAVVITGINIELVIQGIENTLEHITGPIFYRHDIGYQYLDESDQVKVDLGDFIKAKMLEGVDNSSVISGGSNTSRLLSNITTKTEYSKTEYSDLNSDLSSDLSNEEIEDEIIGINRGKLPKIILKNDIFSPITYRQAGVNIDEGNLMIKKIKPMVSSTFTDQVVNDYGNFGSLFKMDDNYFLTSSMDGVGTKVQTVLKLLDHKSAFESLGHDLFSGNINDILCMGYQVKPMFFLDYFGCRSLKASDAVAFVKGLSDACRSSDCILIGGETAELKDFSSKNDDDDDSWYELVGTIVGGVHKEHVFQRDNIHPGDCVVGLRSSGPHTNGYSLINKLINDGLLDGHAWKNELCAPHKNYYHDLNKLRDLSVPIKGICHITGGGLIDNPPRILPDGMSVMWYEWNMPPVFQEIQNVGNISEDEMRRTFNCGIGMILVVDSEKDVELIQSILGDDAIEVGRVQSKRILNKL